MLLEFTVGNFLSFKEKKTFSLEAGSIKEHNNNVFIRGKHKILKSAVIYGANSSGKSNFVKAIEYMLNTIKNSSKLNSTEKLYTKPFLLNTKTINEPSYFEIIFLDIYGNRYRYGFELDNEKIHYEWLYVLNQDSKKEQVYFVRNLEGIGVDPIFSDAHGLEGKTRDNALFLSVADQFNSAIAKKMMRQLTLFTVISGIDHANSISMTDVLYGVNEGIRKNVEEFIEKLDLGFSHFKIDEDASKEFKKRLITIHKLFNENGEIVSDYEFRVSENESSGTNKLFDICGYLVMGYLFGSPIIIDELDAKLHPILTQTIIKLFNDPETNKYGGQLIFTTHDTNLLGANIFRRDQIWFAEKDRVESTDLYSLLEFKENGKTVRSDRSFEADYIRGRYGAIPFISNIKTI